MLDGMFCYIGGHNSKDVYIDIQYKFIVNMSFNEQWLNVRCLLYVFEAAETFMNIFGVKNIQHEEVGVQEF